MCSVQLVSQIHWLMSGERLERAVSVTVGHDLVDEGSGEGEGGCSPVELVTRWLGVVRDFARDEGKSEWVCVSERRPKLVDEPLSCCVVTRAVHKDVVYVVYRCRQAGPACRIRA